MAKKAERTEKEMPIPSGFLQNQWILTISAGLLLSGAYWFEKWPLLAFIALIPCFAIADHPKAAEKLIEHTELLLIIFGIAVFVGFQFDFGAIFSVVGLAFLYSLPFILFVLSRVGGGSLTINFLIVIYWLAIEYLILKGLSVFHIDPGTRPVFIGDFMLYRPEWLSWNLQTGYLSVSMWILISNWIGYVLISKPFRWMVLALMLLIIISPIVYSFFAGGMGITRTDMLMLYSTDTTGVSAYSQYGEWIGRTSAWVSVLVLLFSMVRHKTKKKNDK